MRTSNPIQILWEIIAKILLNSCHTPFTNLRLAFGSLLWRSCYSNHFIKRFKTGRRLWRFFTVLPKTLGTVFSKLGKLRHCYWQSFAKFPTRNTSSAGFGFWCPLQLIGWMLLTGKSPNSSFCGLLEFFETLWALQLLLNPCQHCVCHYFSNPSAPNDHLRTAHSRCLWILTLHHENPQPPIKQKIVNVGVFGWVTSQDRFLWQ